MSRQIFMASMFVASVLILGLAVAPILNVNQVANADDKRLKIDFTIKVQNMKGDKGNPGQNGKDGESIVGPTGPAGASGNVTVNVCQVDTSNCVSQSVGPNSTLTIFVNATGNVVPGNTTIPIPDPNPDVICEPPAVLNATSNLCETPIVVVPPINDTNTGNDTVVIDNGTDFNETSQ